MRKTLEQQGYTYETLRKELKKTEPSSPTVDQTLEKLYTIEANSDLQQSTSILTMLSRNSKGTSCWDASKDAAGESAATSSTQAPRTPSIFDMPGLDAAGLPQQLANAQVAARDLMRTNSNQKGGKGVCNFREKLALLKEVLEPLPMGHEMDVIQKDIDSMLKKFKANSNGTWKLDRHKQTV